MLESSRDALKSAASSLRWLTEDVYKILLEDETLVPEQFDNLQDLFGDMFRGVTSARRIYVSDLHGSRCNSVLQSTDRLEGLIQKQDDTSL